LRSLCFLIFFLLIPLSSLHATVRIGIADDPPYAFFDNTGKPSGFFPELLGILAHDNHWEIEYIPCIWAECLEQLTRNEIDILPSRSDGNEQTKPYNFSKESIAYSYGEIYYRNNTSITALSDLDGLRIAVVADGIYFTGDKGLKQLAAENAIQPIYTKVDSYQNALTLLSSGSVDAALVDSRSALNRHFKFSKSAITIKPTHIHLVFSQASDPQLRKAFDQVISYWKGSPHSELHQLSQKWLSDGTLDTLPFYLPWLKPLFVILLTCLLLFLLIIVLTRRQVRAKTKELAEKNLLLEQELNERKTIEQELTERQQQYQVLFEDSLTSMLLIDPHNGRIVDANPAACEFYKYSRETFKKLHLWDIDQAEKEDIKRNLTEIINTRSHQFEFTHHQTDGQILPVEVFGSPFSIGGKTLICFIIHDIRERKNAEQNLKEQNIFLQSVIDGVSDPLTVIDLDYRILKSNQSAHELFNQAHIEIHEKESFEAGQHHHKEHLASIFEEIKKTRQRFLQIHTRYLDGEKRFIEMSASPLFDSTGQLYAIVEVLRDITERMQIKEILNENEKRLHHLAHHDYLTNLPNRLLFEDRLKHAIRKSRRNHSQLALFFLDIDHFKAINDNLGHDFGDCLLQDVAKRLSHCVRKADTVARMGGDEFLVLLENINSTELIEATAQRIGTTLQYTVSEGDYKQDISASIGIAIYPEDATTAPELLKAADQAMYRAKKSGKAHYQFFNTPEDQSSL
jgi:diguanylate cyclase (GGDEF)-like protein/PAS domain S-box-containing protein